MTNPTIHHARRRQTSHHAAPQHEQSPGTMYVWAAGRLALAGIFLWAFFDKLLGLGYATAAGKAWIDGASPTAGFLKFGATGALGPRFAELAGNPLVDWLFMLGLLGVGTALLLGIGMRMAAMAGVTLMGLMWLALVPMRTNPVLDDHVVYAILLIGLWRSKAGHVLGLGRRWAERSIVKKHPWLE